MPSFFPFPLLFFLSFFLISGLGRRIVLVSLWLCVSVVNGFVSDIVIAECFETSDGSSRQGGRGRPPHTYTTNIMMEIQENVALAPMTTLGVGGAARFFAGAKSVGDVEEAVASARARGLALFVLGGGSNLLVSDRGWDGLVLQVGILGIEGRADQSQGVFDVGAGVDWDEFVAHCVARNCGGTECLSGIPGSVGATPVQNVGAYGQEVSETIVSVLAFDLVENCVRELTAAECGFSYRTSIFNTSQRGRYVILRVTYRLAPDGAPNLRYADLEKYFAGRGAPSLAEVRAAVLHDSREQGDGAEGGGSGERGLVF